MLNTLNDSPDSFEKAIAKICIIFVILAAINLFSGFLQVWCWTSTGERQTQKFRERYVNAILSQEIGWFDSCGAGELSTRVAEITGKIQDGTGRKVGDLIQYTTQFLGSYIAAFYLSWKLTLVLLAALPLIAGSGYFMIESLTAATNQTLGLATEALGAVRTVSALNAQPDVITKYRKFLFKAMQVGITKGFNVGLGTGGLFASVFLTYALGFWYGATLMKKTIDDGCTGSSCLTGGDVAAVFECMIMGSIALGQMAPPIGAFNSAKVAIGKLLEVVNRTPLIDGLSDQGLKPTQKTKGSIEIKNINFAYPSRPNIVVFYDPVSGSVSVDGHDLKDLSVRWLRSQIGYVGQEPVLFT
eukprot:gene34639-42727_t